jgi:heme-degrading monooxygenase HmoA
MMAVIFELVPREGRDMTYLDTAAALQPLLEQMDGFISVERFRSVAQPDKLLSLSFWRDEAAVRQWRNLEAHRLAQQRGRAQVFADYRLTVAEVVRRYGLNDREHAPADSRQWHGAAAP